jgi:phosphoglycolate phosphatase
MLVCFDLDGTLEDSRVDMVSAIQSLREELGLATRGFEDLVPWVSKGMPALYANAFDDVSDVDIQATLPERYAEAYVSRIADETRLYDGIADLLMTLSNVDGIHLAVVTNKPVALSRLLLERLGVLHHFDTVIGGDTFDFAKPNPGMLHGAVEQSGSTGACVMIGDSAGDVNMAKAFGAHSIWCAWGYYTDLPNVELESTAIVPNDVLNILEGVNSVN